MDVMTAIWDWFRDQGNSGAVQAILAALVSGGGLYLGFRRRLRLWWRDFRKAPAPRIGRLPPRSLARGDEFWNAQATTGRRGEWT